MSVGGERPTRPRFRNNLATSFHPSMKAQFFKNLHGVSETYVWNSLADLLDDCVTPKYRRTERATRRPDFNGNMSIDDAIERATKIGDACIVAKAKAFAEKATVFVAGARKGLRSEFHWDVTGDFYDTGEFLTGSPECWQCEREVEHPGVSKPVVTVTVNLGASSAIDSKTLEQRGIYYVALVDILETLGIRVDLWVQSTAKAEYKKYQVCHRLQLKRPDQPLEIDRLAFILGHPGGFRQVWFSALTLVEDKLGAGLGIPVDDPEPYRGDVYASPLLREKPGDDTLLLARIREDLRKCGIEIAEPVGA